VQLLLICCPRRVIPFSVLCYRFRPVRLRSAQAVTWRILRVGMVIVYYYYYLVKLARCGIGSILQEMCESGLINIEKVGLMPTSQKQWLTLWRRWYLKRIIESKCVFTQDVEEYEIRKWGGKQNFWEKNNLEDLMIKWIEFKDGKTPIENWNLMKGIGEGLNTNSLTVSSLFACERIFNSTPCDGFSSSLSCFIFSLSSNSFISFSSLTFLDSPL